MIQKGQVPSKADYPNGTGYAAMKDATLRGSWNLGPWFWRTAEDRQSVVKLEFLQGGFAWPLYETIKVKPKLQ